MVCYTQTIVETNQNQADKAELIYQKLWQRVISQHWKIGDKLPHRHELQAEFGVSLATLQKAMGRLLEQGFLRSRGRLGTFVAERKPNQNHIGLVIGGDPQTVTNWSSMYQAIEARAQAINRQGRWVIRSYYGIGDPNGRDVARLCDDCQHQSLAGLFLVGTGLHHLCQTPIMQATGLVRVALSSHRGLAGVHDIELLPYLDRAIAYLKQRGRQRLVLANSLFQGDMLEYWQSRLRAHGLEYFPYHYVMGYPYDLQPAATAVYHMASQPPRRRPDGLIITDDALVGPLTQSLAEAGVSTPRHLHVLAHCNYPLLPKAAVAVTYVGFDLGQVLDHAVQRIAPLEQQVPQGDFIYEARFEDKLQNQPQWMTMPATSVRLPAVTDQSQIQAPVFAK